MKAKSFKGLSVMVGLIAVLMGLFAASAVAKTTITGTSATVLGPHKAVLNGVIWNMPQGGPYAFEYGTTTAYGSESEIQQLPPGYEFKDVHTEVTGLQPETTYHYRLGTWSEGGLVYGPDRKFTTPGLAKFKASSYPATLSAYQSDGYTELRFEDVAPLMCNEVGATGTLSAASRSIEVTPTFGDCTAFGFENATVAVNGCSYVFTAGDEPGDTGPMDIVCPGSNKIEITAGTCKVSIPAQTGLNAVGVDRDLSGPYDEAVLDADVSGFEYVKEVDSGFWCKLNGTGTANDGEFVGEMSVSGTNSMAAPIDLWVGY